MASQTTSQPIRVYARQLHHDLPSECFHRTPWRLLWLPFHLAVIGSMAAILLNGNLFWGWRLVLSAIIGHSFGVLAFLAHEILHGTIVKSKVLQDWTSTACLLSYCISPDHWRAWHNRFHHGHTNRSGHDPDTFGNITLCKVRPILNTLAKFAPGSGYLRSWLFLGYWLSLQANRVLFIHSKHYNYWSPGERRRQLGVFAGMVTFWGIVFTIVGPVQFFFLYLLPMVVANALQMAYISTNHFLCDETEAANDPLTSTLTVSVPRWMDWLHLNYSYHVEHHLCPYVSPKFAPRVQEALVARYGKRYHHMPLWRALQIVYQTPRIHLSVNELVHLDTGEVFTTIGEHGELPTKIDQVPVPVRPQKRKTKPQLGSDLEGNAGQPRAA